jgi:hypothetical protein
MVRLPQLRWGRPYRHWSKHLRRDFRRRPPDRLRCGSGGNGRGRICPRGMGARYRDRLGSRLRQYSVSAWQEHRADRMLERERRLALGIQQLKPGRLSGHRGRSGRGKRQPLRQALDGCMERVAEVRRGCDAWRRASSRVMRRSICERRSGRGGFVTYEIAIGRASSRLSRRCELWHDKEVDSMKVTSSHNLPPPTLLQDSGMRSPFAAYEALPTRAHSDQTDDPKGSRSGGSGW